MNKKQAFRLATFSLLAILLILMPNFVNPVPVSDIGPFSKLISFILKTLNISLLATETVLQYVNAFFIWLTIFMATRFLKLILGWRAAMFGVILLSLFPRFVGASVQNLIDIPFMFFYFLSFTQIYSMSRELPRFKTKRVIFLFLTLAVTAFIHPAGSVLVIYLIVYLVISTIFKYNAKWHKIEDRKSTLIRISILLMFLTTITILSAFISANYIYNIPFKNPFVVLNLLNYPSSSTYQIFESKLYHSDHLPQHYLIKYLFISTPIVTLIGLFFFMVFIRTIKKDLNILCLFTIVATFLFPIIYSSLSHFNATGFWSVYYFSVPFLVIISIIGIESLLRTIDDRYVNIVISIVLFLLLLAPLRHNIVTAPATSIYFNEFAGGVSSSYGKYSLDLNSHVPKIASKWIIKHIYDSDIRDFKNNDTILVLTDATINCQSFFEKTRYIDVQNGSYQEFKDGKGQYFMSFPDQLDPILLKTNQWPPQNATYTMKIEDAPVVTFIKRPKTKD
ncbi:MAG TPA: hypothetical protein PKG88_01575 [Bacteroidales bacterium]|mgnify:CR=1 FL=1|nr:hypothetical protein [Bacteroidales bacterium]HPS71016.1 hypothetical protein [Bacteroidales bacterium]